MFEIYNRDGRRLMEAPIEGGGYAEALLNEMIKVGYVFKWRGKRWKPGKPEGSAEYEQGSLLEGMVTEVTP